MQSMPITTKVASSNLAHSEVYSIQHYVIKFVSNFLWFPPPIKLSDDFFQLFNWFQLFCRKLLDMVRTVQKWPFWKRV